MLLIDSINEEYEDFVDEIREKTGQTVILEEIENSPDDYLCIVPSPLQPVVTDGVIRSRLYTESKIENRIKSVINILTIYHPTYIIYHPTLLGSDDNVLWHVQVIGSYLTSERLCKRYKELIIDRLNFAIKESEDYNIAEDDRIPSDVYGQITLNPYKHIIN